MIGTKNLESRIQTLDFILWKGWPANPLNLFAGAIQLATRGPSHVSIAHRAGARLTHFEAVARGFVQNPFSLRKRGILCIMRLDWEKLFESDALGRAQEIMIYRMYEMADEEWDYGWGNIISATTKILFRYSTPTRKPLLDDSDSVICSEAASRVANLKGLPGVRVPYENAITASNMRDAWVWPAHFLKSPNLRRVMTLA